MHRGLPSQLSLSPSAPSRIPTSAYPVLSRSETNPLRACSTIGLPKTAPLVKSHIQLYRHGRQATSEWWCTRHHAQKPFPWAAMPRAPSQAMVHSRHKILPPRSIAANHLDPSLSHSAAPSGSMVNWAGPQPLHFSTIKGPHSISNPFPPPHRTSFRNHNNCHRGHCLITRSDFCIARPKPTSRNVRIGRAESRARPCFLAYHLMTIISR